MYGGVDDQHVAMYSNNDAHALYIFGYNNYSWHNHNPLPTGDTQEQVTEQDEDSDDVPGRSNNTFWYCNC